MSRETILRIARSIAAGEIDIVEGCTEICRERWGLSASDRDHAVLFQFVAFDSELDSFPTQKTRHLWNPKVLEDLDRKLENITIRARGEIISAC